MVGCKHDYAAAQPTLQPDQGGQGQQAQLRTVVEGLMHIR